MTKAILTTIAICMALVFIPISIVTFRAYGCINRLELSLLPEVARQVYFERVNVSMFGIEKDRKSISCAPPVLVDDMYYGINVGKISYFECAFRKDNKLYDAQSFQLTTCAYADHWKYIDEGFPKEISIEK